MMLETTIFTNRRAGMSFYMIEYGGVDYYPRSVKMTFVSRTRYFCFSVSF